MTLNDIPKGIKCFIRDNFHSAEQLEVLFFLRAQVPQDMDARTVCRVLRSDEKSIERRLTDLHRRGFLRRSANGSVYLYQYAPEDKLRSLVDNLYPYYLTHKDRILEVVFLGS